MDEGQQKERGLVISDLHLFATRSEGEKRLASIKDELSEIDVLVLNGDIFDFRWSTLPSHEATLKEGIQWLENILSDHPKCRIHFLLGNHDCFTPFQTALSELEKKEPRFDWHNHILRLGPHLFLHGDCTTQRMNQKSFSQYRLKWESDRTRTHGFATLGYSIADSLGITRLVHKAHFRDKVTIDRLTHFLDETEPDWRTTVRFCYFGHTHETIAGLERDGVTFFNTGSGIRRMSFLPAHFTLRE